MDPWLIGIATTIVEAIVTTMMTFEDDLDLFYEDSDDALFNDPKDDDDLFDDPIQQTMHPLDGPTSRRLV